MTRDERLASIRQRATAASDGPWAVGRVDHGDDTAPVVRPDGKTIIEVSTWAGKGVVDAAFVANARFDIPFLLAELDAEEKRTGGRPA